MDIINIFERLATTINEQERDELLAELPTNIHKTYLKNDIHQLRRLISGATHFADTKTVVDK